MITAEPKKTGKYKRSSDRLKNKYRDYKDKNVIGANDIAPIPDVVDIERRESTKFSFKLFCEIYHAKKFRLRWSHTHLNLIETMERAVLDGGGNLAYACPRGFGKTSLAEVLAEWALFHAHKKYVMLVGATNSHALELASSILTDIETNELYSEDFPEICYPIVHLEQQYIKAKTQHCNGLSTRIVYSKNKFVFPTIEGAETSGSVFQCTSITGRIRGAKYLSSTGQSLRPDLVLIDDPQTDKTAKSNKMVEQRERIITGAITGLCGPDEDITILMPCTVIRKDDLAERFLDLEKKPEWQGKRTKLLERFPQNMDLWNKYKEIRDESFRSGNSGREATEFYKQHQTEMDEGAVVSWTERYNPKRQHSAIQAAMDLYFTNPLAFASEYQNEPLIESNDGIVHDLALTVDKLQDRTSGLPYRKVPRSTLHLTTGLDIQGKILYYVTTAWTEDFGGVIVDYGTWPKQPMLTGWSTQDPPIHLGSDNPKLLSTETRVYDGLSKLKDQIFSRGFIRDESTDVMHIGRIGIDANWALSSSAVYSFVREFGSVNDRFIACHGRGISSRMLPMVDWAKKVGEIKGDDWRILPSTVAVNRGRHLSFDTNSWKSTVAERLLLPKGSDNCLLFYGDNITIHEPLINSLTEEYPISREGRFRRINEWVTDKGASSENHYWDALILAAVSAASLGLKRHVKIVSVSTDGNMVTAPLPSKVRPVVHMTPTLSQGRKR